jgi:chromosome partitioning protein
MRVWTVLNQKGGSGKTTLVLHLAMAAIDAGNAVSIIDLDTQRSAEKWGDLRRRETKKSAPAIVHRLHPDIDRMIEAARGAENDLVLIDTPPATNNTTLRAGGVADMIIVPTRSSTLDVEALRDTLQALADADKLERTVVVLNAAIGDKAMLAEIDRITRVEFGVATVSPGLKDQSALAVSLGKGKGITEQARRSKPAMAVVELLETLLRHSRRIERARKRENA